MPTNTRTFTIEINGVTQSISAVDNLLERLDELEDRLNSIGDNGIDVSELRSSLQSIRREIENAGDGWDDFAEKIEDASDNITKLERSMDSLENPFNVNEIRNYTNQVKELSSAMEDVSEASKDIDDLSNLSSDLTTANRSARELSESFNNISRAEDQLGTKLTINLQGMVLQFDDVNQAIGVLEDKLYQLAQSGQRNSQAFTDITNEVVRLRQAVVQTDEAIDNTFSGGFNQLIQGFSSFSSLASIGEGLSQLFGLDNSAIDETLQKFASLSLILQGLSELQQQLQNQTSLTSQAFRLFSTASNEVWDSIGNLVKNIPVLGNAFSSLGDKINNVTNYWKKNDVLAQYNQAIIDQRKAIEDLLPMYKALMDDITEVYNFSPKTKDELSVGITSGARQEVKDFYEGIDSEEAKSELENLARTFDEIDRKVAELNTTGKLNNLTQQANSLGFYLDPVPQKMTLIQRGIVGVVAGVRSLAVAFKALASSTVILLAIQVIVEAISWALEKLGKLWTSFAGDDSLATQFNTTTQAISNANSELERFLTNLEHLSSTNAISNQTRINESIEAYSKALDEAIQKTQQLIRAQGESPQSLSNNLQSDTWSGTWFTGSEIQNVEDFTEQFYLLEKAVEAGVDRFKALKEEANSLNSQSSGNWWNELWNTSGDARTDFAQAQMKVIEDIQYRINNLDLSKGEEVIKEFLDLLNTDMYATSLANIENLFPEDEWAKVLKANIEQIRNYYQEIQKLQREAEIEAIRIQDTITSNNTAAIRDRMARERAELENSYQQELRDAADNEELKLSIQNKYSTQRIALLKQQAQEIRSIQNSISSNEISAMSEGLDKQLAEIELSRQQALDAAKNSELLVEEQILAINKNYDNQVLQAKREFYNQRIQLLQSYASQSRELNNQIAQMEAEIATSRVNNRQEDRISELEYDPASLDSVRDYYDSIASIANEEAEKISKINQEMLSIQLDTDISNEKQRNSDRLRELEESFQSGLLTQEEYDSEVQKEMDNHYLMLQTITRNGEQQLLNIQREYDQTAKNNNATAINERISSLREAYSSIDNRGIQVTNLGIVDFTGSTKQLKEAESAYKEIFSEIARERDNLQAKFDSKQITFNDFIQAKKELDDLEDSVGEAIENIGLQLDQIVTMTVTSITQYVGQYVSILGDLWNTYNEIQMAKLEAEQEQLDEEYEMLEDAYDKQEDLTSKHTDKMKDIEDELTEARGDRRAHLIEQLNAERAALIASLQEEQNIDKQKEANAKKQDAIEAKRREQEKKNSIVQATINTFTAVTNALAVQPWFVGLALSAVALAMGMAQVANIKKQKYASGGLLKGASHLRGGIPIGNTGIEVEGEEYVVNKRSTKKNLPLIDYINSSNRTLTREDLLNFYDKGKKSTSSIKQKMKYETGGTLPNLELPTEDTRIVIEDDRPIVAQIVDIVNRADDYRQIQVLAGLAE